MISWRLKAAACAAVFISVRVFAATDFFDPASGLRIHHYTDPVPDSVPGGVTLNTAELAVLIKQESVILIDVLSINDVRYDELDGSWPDYPARENIPGSLWLPNVGYGSLQTICRRISCPQLTRQRMVSAIHRSSYIACQVAGWDGVRCSICLALGSRGCIGIRMEPMAG